MGQNTTIVVIGNNHADFTLPRALVGIYDMLVNVKIPTALLLEGPSDQDLQTTIQSTQNGIKQTQLIKMLAPEIKDYYLKDSYSKRFYLPKSALSDVRKIVKEKFMPLLGEQKHDEGLLEQVVLEVYRESAYIEEIQLLRMLSNHKIHFAGIDAKTSIFTEQVLGSSRDESTYVNNELDRIKSMVENVSKEITSQFKNGIIFVSTGNNHAHRLAANLMKEFNSKNIDVTIHAYRYYSSYFDEWQKDCDYALEITNSLDSDEIKGIYNILPLKNIDCLEKENNITIPAIDELINNYIKKNTQYSSSSSNNYSLFNSVSPHNQLVIELKKYIERYPNTVKKDFIFNTVDMNKDYTLAFRNVCAWGNYDLVKLFIKYSGELPIDFNKTSSNGNTPLDWFEASKAHSNQKMEIQNILKEIMGITKLAYK